MATTPEQKREQADDLAYTLNHAVSCATTDMLIAPTISALFGVHVGCSDHTHHHGDNEHEHAHTHEPNHDHTLHDHHDHAHYDAHPHMHLHPEGNIHSQSKLNWKLYRNEALHYVKGEIIGDFAAVPLTLFTQRLFPKLGTGLRRLVEPMAAPFFRYGTQRAAKRWGEHAGLTENSAEVVAHAEAMYQHEIEHLPQAILWNMYAFPIGVLGQKWGGHGSSYGQIIVNKSIGALVSNGLLLGGRALVPNIAQGWDHFNSAHIIQPTTRILGKLAGLDEQAIARATNTTSGSWVGRLQEQPAPTEKETAR